jgi:hypothetical protein
MTADLHHSNSRQLAAVLSLATDEDIAWPADDLGAVLRHQLSAPLEIDAGNMDEAAVLRLVAGRRGLLVRSYGELLLHQRPPLPLLRAVKSFAKRCRLARRGALPREVATVLYFAAIVAALSRCGQRISSLSTSALREGVAWVLAQPWVQDPLRGLFEAGRDMLAKAGGDHGN